EPLLPARAPLPLHDALPICLAQVARGAAADLLLQAWSSGPNRVALAVTCSAGPAASRLTPAVRDRLVLPTTDPALDAVVGVPAEDRKSTCLNSSHVKSSYAV